ncbi:MAG: cellulase family glycosylhydrolase [Chloroflexota bacterium]
MLLVLLLAVVAVAPLTPVARAAAADPATAATTTRALGAGSRIPWQGGQWYLHGANMPYINWERDFGGGSRDGVSSPDNMKLLDSTFEKAKATGVNVVRWWAFEGSAWQVKRDGSGNPTGMDPSIYADFDAALDLAEQHDLYYNFVLFSAPSHVPQGWLTNPGQRKQLANVLGQLFAHYKDNPRILSWEAYNEPDHDVWDKKVSEENLRASVREITDSIHANSNAYSTLGMMMLDGLPMSKGLGLDYYQAHWYDYMEAGNWCALCTTYDDVRQRYDLDAPLVIGEIYVGRDVDDPYQRLEQVYAKGYAGAWPWAGLLPERTNDKLGVDWRAMRKFAGLHPDLGPRVTDALAPTNEPDPAKMAFSADAALSSNRVTPGQRLSIDAKISSDTEIEVLVDVEVYTMSGDKVHQQYWDNEAFGAGASKTYSTSWTAPRDAKPGEYVVKVGIFPTGWGKPYKFVDDAGRFTVGR